MRTVRLAVVGCILLGVTAVAEAKGAAIDKAKLVGTWEVITDAVATSATTEFTKDSKLNISIKISGNEIKLSGTYEVDGDKLTTVVNVQGQDAKKTQTIKKLTDTTLVIADADGEQKEYKKKKK